MEARDMFFRTAYYNGEEERAVWEKEVAELSKTLNGIDVFDDFLQQVESIELTHSNSIITDNIIKKYLQEEDSEYIKEILNRCWIANWDSPDFNNAMVQTIPCYDGSHLIRITTELQINLTKMCNLFAIMIYLYFAQSGEYEELSVENAAKMTFMQIKDIENDTDYSTLQLPFSIPNRVKDIYQIAFSSAYKASYSFILFHEIGHLLELENEVAEKYCILSSGLKTTKNEKDLQAEWNADYIGLESIKKLYCDDNFTRWMYICGVLIAFATLALRNENIMNDTDHPSLAKRLKIAKEHAYMWLDETEVKLVEYHFDRICSSLQIVNVWAKNDWWKF